MTQPQPAEAHEAFLENVLVTLWRHKLLILLTTVVGFGTALLLVEEPPEPPPVYQATTTMVVDLASLGSSDTLLGTLPNLGNDRSVQTQIRLMTSKNVMDRAAAKVLQAEAEDGDPPPSAEAIALESLALQARVRVETDRDTNLLQMVATGSSREQAERRANAVVEGYTDYIKATRTRAIEDALIETRETLQTADGDEPSSVATSLLVRLSPELESVSSAVTKALADLAMLEVAAQEREDNAQPTPVPENPAIANLVEGLVQTYDDAAQELTIVAQRLGSIEASFLMQASIPPSTAAADTAALLRSSATSASNASRNLQDAAELLEGASPVTTAHVTSVGSTALTTWLALDALTRQLTTAATRMAPNVTLASQVNAVNNLAAESRDVVNTSRAQVLSLRDAINNAPASEEPSTEPLPSPYLTGLRNSQSLLRSVLGAIDETLALIETNGEGQEVPIRFSALEDASAQLGAANFNLQDAARVIGGIRPSAFDVNESTRLLVVTERLGNTTTRLGTVVQQLNQGISRPDGIDRQELLQLEQELEIARLQPQETGLSIVDQPEAIRINTGSASSSLGVDTRVVAAAVGGLLVGLLGALALEFVDRRVRTPERLRASTGLPLLGRLPKVRRALAAPSPAGADGRISAFDAAMRLAADQILSSFPSHSNAALITSPRPAEGKTVVALNLARLSARAGFKTLLIDGEFATQGAAARLGATSSSGLSTVLRGLTEPATSLTSIEQDLDFLPAGETTNREQSSLLSSAAMSRVLNWATENYDRVYVDCPPIVGHAETILLARQIGNVVLVVNSRNTLLGDVQRAREAAEDVGAVVLGCVLNFVPAESLGFADTSPGESRRWLSFPRLPLVGRFAKSGRREEAAAHEDKGGRSMAQGASGGQTIAGTANRPTNGNSHTGNGKHINNGRR